jgi:hypothetical protein
VAFGERSLSCLGTLPTPMEAKQGLPAKPPATRLDPCRHVEAAALCAFTLWLEGRAPEQRAEQRAEHQDKPPDGPSSHDGPSAKPALSQVPCPGDQRPATSSLHVPCTLCHSVPSVRLLR